MPGTLSVKKNDAYVLGTAAAAKIKVAGRYVPVSDLKMKVNGVYVGGVSPPVNLTLPVITGVPQSSNTLTCDPGTWDGADEIAFQWYRDAIPMIGETGSTLTLISPWIGSVIVCGVTAANQGGSTTEGSNSVTIIP